METIEQVLPAITELKTATVARLDASDATQREIGERLVALEQKGPGPRELLPSSDPSPGDLIIKSPALAMLRAGEVRSIRVPIKSFETKAALTDVSGHTAPMRANEVFGPVGLRVGLRSLIPTQPVTASSVDYVQVTRTGAAGVQVAEGDAKASIDLGAVLVNAPVVTVAAWSAISSQLMSDNLLLTDFVGSTLRDAVQIAEDVEILAGVGGAGHMSGFNVNATAYTRNVVGDTAADTLRRACTQVQLALGQPTGMAINPVGLELLELKKSTTGEYILELEVDAFGRTTVWRIPVVTTVAMPAMGFLVGDFTRGARLYDRMASVVEISAYDSDNFRRNLLTVRCEERLALAIPRPLMFVQGTFV